jgi:hypothetical protein
MKEIHFDLSTITDPMIVPLNVILKDIIPIVPGRPQLDIELAENAVKIIRRFAVLLVCELLDHIKGKTPF